MTRRWPHRLWAVPVLAALGLVAFATLRSVGDSPALADMAPCDSCAARHQHVDRIAETKRTGALP